MARVAWPSDLAHFFTGLNAVTRPDTLFTTFGFVLFIKNGCLSLLCKQRQSCDLGGTYSSTYTLQHIRTEPY